MEDGDTEKYHPSRVIQDFVYLSRKRGCIMCISLQVYSNWVSRIPDRDFRYFYPCKKFLSHIPTHTRSSDPYVSSLSEKSVPHRYPCEISVTNTR